MSVLYAHDAASLLPLLTPHLPYSLPVVGSILSNAAPVVLYTTFAPDAPRPDLWVAIAVLPAPSDQTRVFCSAESAGGAGSAGGASTGPAAAAEAEAAALVCAAVRECIVRHPANAKAGCVAERWCPPLRAALGAQERGVCTVFLGPEDGEMAGAGSADAEAGELVLGPGQAGDEDVIYETSTLRSKDYYRARLPQTTTLRPRAVPGAAPGAYTPPVSFIETHADGSLGALWTHGAWRRRGLALRVTAARIRAMRADDARARAWVVVYVGNEGSERLWEDRLRWERAWRVEWVY